MWSSPVTVAEHRVPFLSVSTTLRILHLVDMTPAQKKLLAIKDTDHGFKVSPRKLPESPSSERSLVFSVTAPPPTSSPSSGRLTPTNLGAGAINYSSHSINLSPYSSPGDPQVETLEPPSPSFLQACTVQTYLDTVPMSLVTVLN